MLALAICVANTEAFVQGKESPSVQLDPSCGGERSLLGNLMAVNFAAQFVLGLYYGFGLFLVNMWHPEATRWLAQHLSAVTDPVARYLPVAMYADTFANPQAGFSTILIRHVFSFLMLINFVPGVILFGLCKKLAAGYARSLNTTPATVKKLMYLFAFISAGSCLPLFVFPVIDHVFNTPVMFMDGLWYLSGCIAPTSLFFSVLQVVAIILAHWNRYLKGS